MEFREGNEPTIPRLLKEADVWDYSQEDHCFNKQNICARNEQTEDTICLGDFFNDLGHKFFYFCFDELTQLFYFLEFRDLQVTQVNGNEAERPSHWTNLIPIFFQGGPIHYTKNGKSSVVGEFLKFLKEPHH